MCHNGLVKETTIAADVEVNHVADSDIDDSKKSLVLLLELLLIENLYGKYTIFGCFPRWCQTLSCHALASHETYMSKTSFQYGFSVFLMTEVVRVCSPPIVATAKGSGNPSFDQLLVSFCL
jgi:hypothetical protein